MCRRPSVLGLLFLLVLYLSLLGGSTFEMADYSWTPAYFDDDDGDFLPFVLSERAPGAPPPLVMWQPVIGVSLAVVVLLVSAQSLVAPARSRLRAPPLFS